MLLDNPVINFLCEQRYKGNVGFIPAEIIREKVGHARGGSWNKMLNALHERGLIRRGLDTDSFRKFMYCVDDEVFDKWLISITKPR